jgi:hypothetical protein
LLARHAMAPRAWRKCSGDLCAVRGGSASPCSWPTT